MKILFLCGSLAPGKDGVGDYTRRLACELRKHQHETFIISLNDLFVPASTQEAQASEGVEIPVLRLSAIESWKDRIAQAKTWIEAQNPDWLSLQYVSYSFHPKGLPFGFSRLLEHLVKGRKWHIMFHELWLGIKKDSPLSHYFYGFFQKKLIQQLIHTLSPVYITTSNRIYQLELQRAGNKADILMLFSNIPVVEKDERFIHTIYQKLGIEALQASHYLFIGAFGSLSDRIDYEKIVQEQAALARQKEKQLAFIHFGRAGSPEKLQELKNTFQNEVRFVSLGELSDRQVSSVLQIINIGVSSTPEEYIGKSGVYAAMRLHNLSVLLYSGMKIPQYKKEIEVFNKYLETREPYTWDVKYIAAIFYENLRLHTNLQPG